MPEPSPNMHRRRGIYLLPNLFTTGAMFAGFYAIVAAFVGSFAVAAIAVFVAAVLDSLDGRVARLTHTQSEFGAQYDSLSDMVSFGLAPALVMYAWSLSTLHMDGPILGKLGWCAAFVYAACGALRLARFNTQIGIADKRYFQGLPSPAAAGWCMAFVWSMHDLDFSGAELRYFTPALIVIAGLLMVSRVRYASFKSWPLNDRVSFLWIIAVVLVLAGLALKPAYVLLSLGTIYVLSGPVLTLRGLRSARRNRRKALPTDLP
ncbi:MAG TPA: CDP-diacylglycerol--serine O-phosphatidyltransferase [Rhodanobacteraceae bacterium]|nr:CDP-diacylglycerol--serine O-phosphatidyltransferase [Rhodanobacteraceae bacterium]